MDLMGQSGSGRLICISYLSLTMSLSSIRVLICSNSLIECVYTVRIQMTLGQREGGPVGNCTDMSVCLGVDIPRPFQVGGWRSSQSTLERGVRDD